MEPRTVVMVEAGGEGMGPDCGKPFWNKVSLERRMVVDQRGERRWVVGEGWVRWNVCRVGVGREESWLWALKPVVWRGIVVRDLGWRRGDFLSFLDKERS